MKLFVANTTLQHHRIHFRLPEQAPKTAARYADIAPLSQVLVLEETSEAVQHVIRQLETYGARNAKDVRSNEVHPLIYTVDKEVAVDRIGQTHESNQARLDEEAFESRKIGAAASAGDANTLEVSVEEQAKPGTEKVLRAEKIAVDRKAK